MALSSRAEDEGPQVPRQEPRVRSGTARLRHPGTAHAAGHSTERCSELLSAHSPPCSGPQADPGQPQGSLESGRINAWVNPCLAVFEDPQWHGTRGRAGPGWRLPSARLALAGWPPARRALPSLEWQGWARGCVWSCFLLTSRDGGSAAL